MSQEVKAEAFKYTYRFEDGSYYRYLGDCTRSHRCGYLKDADYYNDPSDLKFWAAENINGTVIKVKITYEEIENDLERN